MYLLKIMRYKRFEMKKIVSIILSVTLVIFLFNGCGVAVYNEGIDMEGAIDVGQDKVVSTEISVFIAASLSSVMEEIAQSYNELHPEVKILFNADSSGTLKTQIEEGAGCDIFFPAAQKQMNELENEGLIVSEKRTNIVNNQVVVIALSDSNTQVTGLDSINKATSLALADGSVPVGKYTRCALMNLGVLEVCDDPSVYTTKEISDALDGLEISEQGNVSKVLLNVVEGSCEIGTTYYSDIYGYEDRIKILEKVPYELTGDVIYPVARVVNKEADEVISDAADEFYEYIISDEAKAIFEKYYFGTDFE